MDSFELEADGVNTLFARCEVDLTQAVVEITDLTRVNLSTRWRQRRFHIQRVGAYSKQAAECRIPAELHTLKIETRYKLI